MVLLPPVVKGPLQVRVVPERPSSGGHWPTTRSARNKLVAVDESHDSARLIVRKLIMALAVDKVPVALRVVFEALDRLGGKPAQDVAPFVIDPPCLQELSGQR